MLTIFLSAFRDKEKEVAFVFNFVAKLLQLILEFHFLTFLELKYFIFSIEDYFDFTPKACAVAFGLEKFTPNSPYMFRELLNSVILTRGAPKSSRDDAIF